MIRYVLSMLAVLVAVRAVPEVAKGITFSRTVKDGPGADGAECFTFTFVHLRARCCWAHFEGPDLAWVGVHCYA